MICGWGSSARRPPPRQLPTRAPGLQRKTGFAIRALRFSVHLRETTAGSVGLARSRCIQGYASAHEPERIAVIEHPLRSRFRFATNAVDGRPIDLSIATRVGDDREPRPRLLGLTLLLVSWRAPLQTRMFIVMQRRHMLQDVANRRCVGHMSLPRPSPTDVEHMSYRTSGSPFDLLREALSGGSATASTTLHLLAN